MTLGWLTLLSDAPDLGGMHSDLEAVAEFDIRSFPQTASTHSFEIRCGLCGQLLLGKLLARDTDTTCMALLDALSEKVRLSNGDSDTKLVLDHLSQTRFVFQTCAEFAPDCDCDFRLHQVAASGRFLWYTDGQFADDVDEYLDLTPTSDGGTT